MKKSSVAFALLISLTSWVHAAVISVTLKTAFPARVNLGDSTPITAEYIVHNNKPYALHDLTYNSLSSLISKNLSSTCGTSLAAQQSCQLDLTLAPSQLGAISGGPQVCAGYGTYCAVPLPSEQINLVVLPAVNDDYAYIVNNGNNSISLCALNANGSLSASDCQDSGGSDFSAPLDIAIDRMKKRAYVVNGSGNIPITLCTINVDGKLTACKNAEGTGFISPRQIVLNSTGTQIYVVNGFASISLCTIEADGTLSDCRDSGAPTPSRTLVLNPSNTVAYVAISRSPAYLGFNICVVQGDGTIGSCTNGPTFSYALLPYRYVLNPAGTYLYLIISAQPPPISFTSTNGTSTGSALTDPTFSSVTDIGFNDVGNQAYVVNQGNNTVSLCTVEANGAFSNCTDSGAGSIFQSPSAIALTK